MSSTIDAENTIAFMGVEGANADLACRQFYPYMHTLACASFEDVFSAVELGRAKYGLIPIENSQAGRVAEIHNILPRTKLHIVGEHVQLVKHSLLGVKGAELAGVKHVYSHPQALMQCREYIRGKGFIKHPYSDTASAARDVAQWGDPEKAAISSSLAGELYGLERIEENIQDSENNRTLFITLANEPIDPEPEDGTVLTSVLFSVRSIPASLYKALGGFATNGVNIVKLESYVYGDGSNIAQFFVTFEGHPRERNVQLSLEELGFFCQKVNVLGVYHADPSRG